MHSIGHGIVAALLRADGFSVADIGIDVHIPVWVQKAKEANPDIIGMSALLTVTMPFMEFITKALREASVPAKIIIGGAPVTREYADKIGVAYAENAAEACLVCRKLVEGRK
jgi:5-methyltetrahydrofolate--homocysteine methyltransferase